MNTEPFDEFESQLAAVRKGSAPSALRSAVLNDVDRELRASRWDRRLMRAAMLLLVIGVGFNTALVFDDARSESAFPRAAATARSREALIETAVVVSDSTDAATGRRFAEQWAAYSGRELTAQEVETLESLVTKDRG
jgi:FPC/CPF motif-containing protein YcgG